MTALSVPALDDSGSVKATIDIGDAWQALIANNQPFSPTTEPLVSVGLSEQSALTLGSGPFTVKVKSSGRFGSRLRVFWPDPARTKDPVLDISSVMPDFDTQPRNGQGPVGLLLALDGQSPPTQRL